MQNTYPDPSLPIDSTKAQVGAMYALYALVATMALDREAGSAASDAILEGCWQGCPAAQV